MKLAILVSIYNYVDLLICLSKISFLLNFSEKKYTTNLTKTSLPKRKDLYLVVESLTNLLFFISSL